MQSCYVHYVVLFLQALSEKYIMNWHMNKFRVKISIRYNTGRNTKSFRYRIKSKENEQFQS